MGSNGATEGRRNSDRRLHVVQPHRPGRLGYRSQGRRRTCESPWTVRLESEDSTGGRSLPTPHLAVEGHHSARESRAHARLLTLKQNFMTPSSPRILCASLVAV